MPIKKHFIRFIKYPAGERFAHYYDLVNRRINHNIYIKILLTFIGIISFIIGFILLFIPGPGILFILISAVLFCLSSRKLALFFDQFEIKIRLWLKR